MSIFSTERYADSMAMLMQVFKGMSSDMWTAEVGIIQGPPDADGTVTVQLAIQGRVVDENDNVSFVQIVNLQKCPIQYFGGKGFWVTHPVDAGDECLVVFARRAIDSWWQNGGSQPPISLRLHDINDGFCVPGFLSRPNALANVSQTSIQVRTTDSVIMDITGSTVTINANVVVNGNITATGTITGTTDVVASTGGSAISLLDHLHADSGGTGNSGPPVGGT